MKMAIPTAQMVQRNRVAQIRPMRSQTKKALQSVSNVEPHKGTNCVSLHERSNNGSKLDHGRDIGLDISLLALGVGVIFDGSLEVGRVEGA